MILSLVTARRFHILFVALFLTLTNVKAQNTVKSVTLEGQFVCSECWFEADRGTTPYGNAADIQCARDCSVKGIPPAVAVKEGSDFKLYLIESGQFKKSGDEWIEYIGKLVRFSGRLQMKKERAVVSVDGFKVVGDPALKTSNVIGAQVDLASISLE